MNLSGCWVYVKGASISLFKDDSKQLESIARIPSKYPVSIYNIYFEI